MLVTKTAIQKWLQKLTKKEDTGKVDAEMAGVDYIGRRINL